MCKQLINLLSLENVFIVSVTGFAFASFVLIFKYMIRRTPNNHLLPAFFQTIHDSTFLLVISVLLAPLSAALLWIVNDLLTQGEYGSLITTCSLRVPNLSLPVFAGLLIAAIVFTTVMLWLNDRLSPPLPYAPLWLTDSLEDYAPLLIRWTL